MNPRRVISIRFLIISFIILFSTTLFAQDVSRKQVLIDVKYLEVNKRFVSSIGFHAAIPVEEWNDYYGVGSGIFYEGRWLANDYISVYGQFGYNYFFPREIDYMGTPITYDGKHQLYLIPGIRVNVVGNLHTYIGAGGSYAAVDDDGQFSLVVEAGFGIDFVTSKAKPLTNTIPVIGIRGGIMSFKYDDDYRTSVGVKLILTLTKATIVNDK